jgi:hypothetical protein
MNDYSFYIQGANIFEMKKYLFFSCFLIGITSQAQIGNFILYGSANCPFIKDFEAEQKTVPVTIPSATGYSSFMLATGIKETYTPKVGFEIGTRFDYPIASRFFLTSGLSVGYLRFQRTVEVTSLPDVRFQVNTPLPTAVGLPFGSFFGSFRWRDLDGNVVANPPTFPQRSENIGNTTTLSVQVPLLVGTSFFGEKLEVRTGAIGSYLLHATQVKDEFSAATMSFREYKDSSKAGFNEFQAGVAIQSSYALGEKIGVDFTAQKFFTSIYEGNEQSGGSAKYNVLTLGLSYHL